MTKLQKKGCAIVLSGYQDIRPLNASEQEALPWLRVVNKLWMLALRAHYVEHIGWLRFDGAVLARVHSYLTENMLG